MWVRESKEAMTKIKKGDVDGQLKSSQITDTADRTQTDTDTTHNNCGAYNTPGGQYVYIYIYI